MFGYFAGRRGAECSLQGAECSLQDAGCNLRGTGFGAWFAGCGV